MGMNPSRYDRWPKPRRLRHVWVRPDPDRGPVQGFVIRWELWGDQWRAFVVFARDNEEPRTDWFAPGELVPVMWHDPEELPGGKALFGPRHLGRGERDDRY